MSTFAQDVADWVSKAKLTADQAVRGIAIGVLKSVVYKSPVGNPERWAINAIASTYNTEVANFNAALRDDPANLQKNGRLKRGKLVRDSMDIVAPDGYVGGRFRGNWVLTIGEADTTTLDRVDPDGGETITEESAKLSDFVAGTPIFIVNNLPYASRLEYEAWSKQAPLGMVRVTIAEFQLIVNQEVSTLK